MNRELIKKAINVIDDILLLLSKESKWDVMANKISNVLLTEVTELQKEGVNKFISYITSGDGAITQKEVAMGLNELEKLLGNSLISKLDESVKDFQSLAYSAGFGTVNSKLKFNQADEDALNWLSKDQNYWIGEHYESQLKEKMVSTAKEIVNESLDREEATKRFKSKFNDNFKRSNSYWEALGDHIVTRSREFGRTSAYQKAGINYVKVSAVVDDRTSDICRNLNGRIIAVSKLVQQRDNLMNAKSPEETKKIAPWLSKKDIAIKVKGIETSKLPKGVALPPYHFRCRTRTVVAYENELNTNIAEAGLTHKDITERLKSKIINNQKPSKDEIVKLIEIVKGSKWDASKVKEFNKYSAQHHYEKHKKEFASDSMAQYNSKMIELFRNPKRELHAGIKNDKLVLTAYLNKEYGIVDIENKLLGTYHKARVGWYKNMLKKINNLSKLSSDGIYKRMKEWMLEN